MSSAIEPPFISKPDGAEDIIDTSGDVVGWWRYSDRPEPAVEPPFDSGDEDAEFCGFISLPPIELIPADEPPTDCPHDPQCASLAECVVNWAMSSDADDEADDVK